MRDDDMEKLLRDVERQLGAAWGDAVEWLRDHNKLSDIAVRLTAGDLTGAVQGVHDAAVRFATEVADAYTVSGQTAAEWLDKLVNDKLVSFDGTNARAVKWAERNKMDLVREITVEQQNVLRNVVADGVRAGKNPRVVARDLRASIGLTEVQERHVSSYRRALETGDYSNALSRELRDARSDKALRRALEDGTAIDPKRIDKMVERYRKNWIGYRSEVIARTEGLRAVHEGTEELFRQSIDASQLEGMVVVRQWNALRDKATRSSHRKMHGQKRALGAKFRTGDGYDIAYPGDPNAPAKEIIQCRCVLSTRLMSAEQAHALFEVQAAAEASRAAA